jgi:hypothetical protein
MLKLHIKTSLHSIDYSKTQITLIQNPDWFLIIPYKITPDNPDPHSLLGLTLTSIGIALLSLGIILALHYTRERTGYMKQLRRVSAPEETENKKKTTTKTQKTKTNNLKPNPSPPQSA